MKLFLLNIGEILIDEIDVSIALSGTWSLNGNNYVRGSSGKYRGRYLHDIIAERMGLDLSNHIDHEDGNTLNNQRLNLRTATYSQNAANSKIRITNKSGFKGVCTMRDKYQAMITVDSKLKYLGTFDTPQEAHEAYKEAADKYFGEFSNHG